MSSPSPNDETDRTRAKVAIVGAGASGLMCAHTLIKKGIASKEEIVVLEARDRVGGRIHTTEETVTTSSGNPIRLYRDHGAAWVHGTGFDWPAFSPQQTTTSREENDDDEDGLPTSNPMMELLQQATPEGENVCLTHLEPTFVLGNPWMRPGHVLLGPKNLALFVDGKKIGGENDEVALREALDLHNDIMAKVGRIGRAMIVNGRSKETVDQSFQHALDQVLAAQQSDAADNGTDQGGKKELVPKIAAFYRHLIEAWHGTSSSGLQLHEFSAQGPDDDEDVGDEEWEDEGDFYGPHCTTKTGMKTVLEPLLETVSSCIRLNQPVRRVAHREDDNQQTVQVETSSGMLVDAEVCVMTVPLGCLAHSLRSSGEESGEMKKGKIVFAPTLCSAKVEAIHRMCMGSYKKVYLSFDRIFWPRKEPFLGLIRDAVRGSKDQEDGIGDCMLLDNLWACKDIPCIEAVLIGDAGKWATDKPDETLCNAVLGFLADAMGFELESQLKAWCVECHITRWEEDPYSRGAYSGYRLGTLEEHTDCLAASEWDGRLLFAGEATLSGYEGSVHAALISGVNAAREIEEKGL